MSELNESDFVNVPEMWVNGTSSVLKYSFALNGAILVACPTVLKLSTNTAEILNTIISVAIVGLIISLIGMLMLGTQTYQSETGLPVFTYQFARNCAWCSSSFGSMSLLMIGLILYDKSSVPEHWFKLFVIVFLLPFILGTWANLHQRYRYNREKIDDSK